MSSVATNRFRLVVSDFHLGAGHRNADGSLNILEDFHHDREFIEFLEYYSTGTFKNAEVELVINGDFFNLIMIDYQEPEADVVTELVALRRMKRIMEGHRAVMNALKFFQSNDQKNITFIMGNHDPGILFPSIQDLIRHFCGEKTRFFLESYEVDGIHIEHGNQHEIANRFDRERPFLTVGLPEPILNQPWGTLFYCHVINTIKRAKPHFDKVLPLGIYLRWLMVYDFRTWFKVVKMIVWYFFKSRFKNDPRRYNPFSQTLQIMFGAQVSPDLDEAAEHILLTRDDVHTVIFGHNHRPLTREFAPGKQYINTGTWNEMTHLTMDRMGTRLSCTFAFIEYAGLRPRASLKIWRGRRRITTESALA